MHQQRQPPKVVRYLWEPLCIAALNTGIEQASARIFLNVLRDAFTRSAADSDLLIPRADLGALFADLAAKAITAAGGQVHLGAAVESGRACPGALGWTVGAGTGASRYATPGSHAPCHPGAASDLLPPQCAAAIAQMEALAYEPILTCYLQYPPEVRLPRPMIGLSREISQWAFDRGQLDGKAGLIAVVVSAAGRLRGAEPAQLAAAIHAELSEVVANLPAAAMASPDQRKARHLPRRARAGTSRSRPALARPGAGGRLCRQRLSSHPGRRRTRRHRRGQIIAWRDSLTLTTAPQGDLS